MPKHTSTKDMIPSLSLAQINQITGRAFTEESLKKALNDKKSIEYAAVIGALILVLGKEKGMAQTQTATQFVSENKASTVNSANSVTETIKSDNAQKPMTQQEKAQTNIGKEIKLLTQQLAQVTQNLQQNQQALQNTIQQASQQTVIAQQLMNQITNQQQTFGNTPTPGQTPTPEPENTSTSSHAQIPEKTFTSNHALRFELKKVPTLDEIYEEASEVFKNNKEGFFSHQFSFFDLIRDEHKPLQQEFVRALYNVSNYNNKINDYTTIIVRDSNERNRLMDQLQNRNQSFDYYHYDKTSTFNSNNKMPTFNSNDQDGIQFKQFKI